MNKWKVILPLLAVALFAAWYAFRPERLYINQQVDEALPAADQIPAPQAIESGSFSGAAHPTTGTATVYRLADGGRILRFTNFKTSNGPDVHVYLVGADDVNAAVRRGEFIDLGTIKGDIGDQNYSLASDLDLSKYSAVSIWCKRFAVNFGAAPLRVDSGTLEN